MAIIAKTRIEDGPQGLFKQSERTNVAYVGTLNEIREHAKNPREDGDLLGQEAVHKARR